ncbi:MAG: c-type cytochrome [Acidimicrobiia bacterium]
MRTWGEGILAGLIVVIIGFALYLSTGQSLGGGTPESTVPVAADPEAVSRGIILAEGTGCLVCHSVDGTPGSGPTWKGVAGSSRPLESGETVIADDEYLHTSIVDPASQLLAGYDDVMPDDYGTQLSAEEISDLVEYIKSLSA